MIRSFIIHNKRLGREAVTFRKNWRFPLEGPCAGGVVLGAVFWSAWRSKTLQRCPGPFILAGEAGRASGQSPRDETYNRVRGAGRSAVLLAIAVALVIDRLRPRKRKRVTLSIDIEE